MNYRFFLFIIFSLLLAFQSKAQIKTIYLNDFGAVANDNKSDQQAFNAAAAYINKRGGYVKLLIKAGKYLVGPAFKYTGDDSKIPLGKISDVLALTSCKNVAIEGIGHVEIKFLDNIPFGTGPTQLNGRDSAVHIGSLFRIINCNGVSITNLKCEGNLAKFKLLKTWGVGQNAYEREHDGLFLYNSQNVSVKNASFNGFGRDGCMLIEDNSGLAAKNIFFTDCTFNNNGRDGMSWCGGENIRLYNCVLNGNGAGRIKTNPGSGLDIEPERGAKCTNGSFIKCQIAENGGYAITSGYDLSSNIIFDSCTIAAFTNSALYCSSPKMTFTNCKIYGASLVYYNADKAEDGVKFLNCVFTDSVAKKILFAPTYLVAVTGRYVQFKNCQFNSYKVVCMYNDIVKKEEKASMENTLFENCKFNAYFTKPHVWGRLAILVGNCRFVSCVFTASKFADYSLVFSETSRNIYQQNSTFLKLK